MMEFTAVGMGLMMTAVSVLFGGIVLEASLMMLSRSLRPAPLVTSLEPQVSREAHSIELTLPNNGCEAPHTLAQIHVGRLPYPSLG